MSVSSAGKNRKPKNMAEENQSKQGLLLSGVYLGVRKEEFEARKVRDFEIKASWRYTHTMGCNGPVGFESFEFVEDMPPGGSARPMKPGTLMSVNVSLRTYVTAKGVAVTSLTLL